MTKLWQKGYHLNEQVERFEAAQNSILDARLIRHDVWGSLAHTAMLAKIGVLTEPEHKALKNALCNILQLETTNESLSRWPMKTYTRALRTTWLQRQVQQERRFTWHARATIRYW